MNYRLTFTFPKYLLRGTGVPLKRALFMGANEIKRIPRSTSTGIRKLYCSCSRSSTWLSRWWQLQVLDLEY
jgi:hypothetical protein